MKLIFAVIPYSIASVVLGIVAFIAFIVDMSVGLLFDDGKTIIHTVTTLVVFLPLAAFLPYIFKRKWSRIGKEKTFIFYTPQFWSVLACVVWVGGFALEFLMLHIL